MNCGLKCFYLSLVCLPICFICLVMLFIVNSIYPTVTCWPALFELGFFQALMQQVRILTRSPAKGFHLEKNIAWETVCALTFPIHQGRIPVTDSKVWEIIQKIPKEGSCWKCTSRVFLGSTWLISHWSSSAIIRQTENEHHFSSMTNVHSILQYCFSHTTGSHAKLKMPLSL